MINLAHKCLLSLDPELSHHLALWGLPLLPLRQRINADPIELMGLTFPNRIGLAAGLDKNAEALTAWHNIGFGFIEVGTVTPKAQPGNPKPRMFRIPEKQALINRMGFNNHGIDYLMNNIEEYRLNNSGGALIGVNLGKNAHTPIDAAVNDYLVGLRKAYCLADYITINISSPNTQNLRSLQQGARLEGLLECLKTEQQLLQQKYHKYTPIVVKIAPDLTALELDECAQVITHAEIDGVIATNTTLDRSMVQGLVHADEAGGLSGAVLAQRATEVVAQLVARLPATIPVIASGGVMTPQDAKDKLLAGAKLVQVYTGFIYQGPTLIKQISEKI